MCLYVCASTYKPCLNFWRLCIPLILSNYDYDTHLKFGIALNTVVTLICRI